VSFLRESLERHTFGAHSELVETKETGRKHDDGIERATVGPFGIQLRALWRNASRASARRRGVSMCRVDFAEDRFCGGAP
jgi:hypothetical protein